MYCYVVKCSKMTSYPPSEGLSEITFGSICSRSLCSILVFPVCKSYKVFPKIVTKYVLHTTAHYLWLKNNLTS